MSWREFCYLVNGLGPDTPLGRVVAIRAEDDPEILKNFTPDQRAMRMKYRRKMAKEMAPEDVERALESMKQAFIKMTS